MIVVLHVGFENRTCVLWKTAITLELGAISIGRQFLVKKLRLFL